MSALDQPLGELPAYLSLGAGVQSTTMLLLAEHGEIPRPIAAIFADTQWEPKAVYRHLDWLESVVTTPVVRVTRGDLRENIMAASRGEAHLYATRYAAPPLHFKDPDGIGHRQCTSQFKLQPIIDELRRRGHGPKSPCEQWLGISLDELTRLKPSRVSWQHTRFPLVNLRMTRNDCLRWMAEHGYPEPPKSACVGCPLHANGQWRDIKADPDEWADALEVDEAVRRMDGIEGTAYLHYSRTPLADLDLSTPEERGQMCLLEQAECEGGCFT